ncbi:MAG: IS1182 family transposase [Nanoarchaeota archaeon]|nr:IS1182 family transposase [Nanoarchaeota archaeon]
MVFIKSLKGQSWLLPPNIKDMIPKDHICFLVEKVVDKLDFSNFEIKYSGAGHPAYHPRIICKILVQSMLDRIRSSRAIARNIQENVVFMYLAEKLTPNFRTISDFRKDNSDLLKDIFKITISTAKELGAIGLEQLSIDGSKLKACAANNSSITKVQLEVIEQYVSHELKEGIEIDRVEDKHFKDCRGYDQLKETDKKKIKSLIAKYYKQIKKDNHDRVSEIKYTIKEAKKELENNKLEKVSLTDSEARFMKNKKGRIELSYNSQITTDHKMGIIVANDVCKESFDNNQLQPQIKQTEENCGKLKKGIKVTIDNGYYSGENIDYLNKKKFDGYIPNQEESQKAKGKKVDITKFDKRNFKYLKKEDKYLCPEGQKLKFNYESYDKIKNKNIKIYKGMNCKECLFNKECTKRKDRIREIKKIPFEKERIEMAEKMQTQKAKEIYKERKQVVEPVIGHYKENLGFRDFLTRKLKTVKNEFNLVCTAHNLKKIWIIIQKKNNKINNIVEKAYVISLI